MDRVIAQGSASPWRQIAYLKASNTGNEGGGDDIEGDQFGFSLALSGDGNTLAVGAISEDSSARGINGDQSDDSAASSGAVYVFTRTGSAWTHQAYGPMEDSASRAPEGVQEDNSATGSGAAYVFARSSR